MLKFLRIGSEIVTCFKGPEWRNRTLKSLNISLVTASGLLPSTVWQKFASKTRHGRFIHKLYHLDDRRLDLAASGNGKNCRMCSLTLSGKLLILSSLISIFLWFHSES
ncbi:hypothetical protein LINPERHAP1_LOCUS35825 [Linum perenne]